MSSLLKFFCALSIALPGYAMAASYTCTHQAKPELKEKGYDRDWQAGVVLDESNLLMTVTFPNGGEQREGHVVRRKVTLKLADDKMHKGTMYDLNYASLYDSSKVQYDRLFFDETDRVIYFYWGGPNVSKCALN